MKSRWEHPTKQMQDAVRLQRIKDKMDEVMMGLNGYGEDFEYKIDADFRRIGFRPFEEDEPNE